MSVGLTRNVYDFGSGVPAAAVTLNTRQFDVAAAGKQLAELVDGRFAFQVVERVEKAAVIVAAIIVVVGFVATKMFESFFAEAGKDLYTYVKQLRRRDTPAAPVEVHFHLFLHQTSKTPVVVLAVDQGVSPQDLSDLDAGPIRDAIAAAGGEGNLQRVVGTVAPGGGVKVSYLVDSQGRPI